MDMVKSMISALAVSIASVAVAAESYDDYVWLNKADTAKSSSFFNNDNGGWQKKGSDGNWVTEQDGPHKGAKYYIPKDMLLTTPDETGSATSPIEYVFAGDELSVKDRLQVILKRSKSSSDDANVRIDNLVLLPNGHIYSASERAASVSGKCTVKGTKSNPSSWYHGNENGATVVLKSKLCGEKNSVFKVRYKSPGKVTLKYLGDASEFYGTMLLDSSCAQLTAATPGGAVFPGAIDISNGAVFEISAGNSVTVGDLVSNGGIILLNVNNNDRASLVVTNAITATGGRPIQLEYPVKLTGEAESFMPVTVAAGASAELSADTFAVFGQKVDVTTGLADCPEALLQNLSLSVTTGEDGAQVLTLSHRKVVCLNEGDGSAEGSFMLDANAGHWSDDSVISPFNDYYVGNLKNGYFPSGTATFGGATLTLCGEYALYIRKKCDITVPDFRWVANDEGTAQIAVDVNATLSGKIRVVDVPDKAFHVEMWNGGDSSKLFNIVSELDGDGALALTLRSDAATDPRAYFRLSGINGNFTGRIHLSHKAFDGINKATYNADPDKYCVTLIVSDSRNLGGARSGFAKDALLLADHSLLKTEGSLVFDEPTRGWSINGIGRVHVDAGETLVVTNKQITYSGEFRKEGEGLLKLGGTARFTEDALETPLEGMNILSIAAGSVMPTDVTAFNGLEVRFAAGTKLVLNPLQGGDISKYGMYNVKWDNPVVVAGDAALPVHLSLPENFDKEAKYSFGVITVNPTAAADIDVNDIAVKAPKGTKASVSKEENVDENGVVTSVTYVCTLSRAAFVMVVR